MARGRQMPDAPQGGASAVTMRFFFALPDEDARRAYVEEARNELGAALEAYSEESLPSLPVFASAPAEEIAAAAQRMKEPYADLEARAAANEELFVRWSAAADRGDAAEADRLFREVVIARWFAGRQIVQVDRASVPPAEVLASLATDVDEGALRLVAATGQEAAIKRIAFAPGEAAPRRFAITSADGTVYDWDAASGRLASVGAASPYESAPGGDFLVERIGPEDRTKSRVIRDPETGAAIGYVDVVAGSEVTQVGVSAARDRVLLLHADGKAFVGALTAAPEWLIEPAPLWSAQLHRARSAALSPDGVIVVAGREDGAFQVWDLENDTRLCHALGLPDGRWAVSDDEGRFDASDGGHEAALRWVVGDETIELSQLKAEYYEPFLLAKKLGHNKEPLRRVIALEQRLLKVDFPGLPALKLAPEVHHEIEETAKGPKLHLVVTDRGGGIGPVSVKINGKEAFICRIEGNEVAIERSVPSEGWSEAKVEVNARGAVQMRCGFRFTGHPFSVTGEQDQVTVSAASADGAVASREVMTSVKAAAGTAEPPRLWAIIAGVARYADERLQLRYPAKDAEDFAAALLAGAPGVFAAERIDIKTFTSQREKPEEQPTRANLEAAFQEARRAASSDVLVVYLAGHGAQLRAAGDDDFYFLTQEAPSSDLSDPEVRARAAISGDELTAWIKQIPALAQAMVLDTCHAGQAALDVAEMPSGQVRAIERLKDRAGLFILAGAAADAVSLEASRYEQGLLTYALLFGMCGPALLEDQHVDVLSLASYAIREVPRFAGAIGGVQRPVLAVPHAGKTFNIAMISDEALASFHLVYPLPVLVCGNFIDEGDGSEDTIGLGKALEDALRKKSADMAAAPFLFVGRGKFPGAYRLNGKYVLKNRNPKVSLRLQLGDQRLLDNVEVEGQAGKVAELAQRIGEAAAAALLAARPG